MKNRSIIAMSIAGVLASLALAGCGGGSSTSGGAAAASPAGASNPAGSAGNSNSAVGSVTGFGSVVVDGIHYDDVSASVQRENAPGVSGQAEAKLGQRVMVTFDGQNKASKIEVLPELEGPISTIDAAKLRFIVNNLTVAVNSDPAAGPLTVFSGGFKSFADLVKGDSVEVHGMAKLDTTAGAATNTFVVQATRIEKQTAAGPFLRAGGFVQGLTTTASATTFKLGGLTVDATGVTLKPAGATLADGKYVFVMSNQAVSAGAMKATSVRVFDRKTANPSDVVRLAGQVAAFDATAVTFQLDGVSVNAKAAKLLPKNATIGDGMYARASGVFDDKGVLVATEVQVRDESAPQVEIKGSVANFTAVNDFTVRGVPVDATKATLTSCPATGLANDQFVLVHGRVTLTSPKVQADTIVCTATQAVPAGEIIERQGVASALDATTKSLTLTMLGGASIKVVWTDTTFFDGLTAANASGVKLQVEGVLGADVSIMARKIRPLR